MLQALILFNIKDSMIRDKLDVDAAIDQACERLKAIGVTEDEFTVGFARLVCRALKLPI